jgi:hypothetical protein
MVLIHIAPFPLVGIFLGKESITSYCLTARVRGNQHPYSFDFLSVLVIIAPHDMTTTLAHAQCSKIRHPPKRSSSTTNYLSDSVQRFEDRYNLNSDIFIKIFKGFRRDLY